MTGRPSIKRSLFIWTVVVTTVLFMISTGLPWLARNGYAGEVIQENLRYDRDASALFYTDHERAWEILKALPPAK